MTVDEWSRILRQAVAPVGAAYLVVLVMLLAYRRDRGERGAPDRAGRVGPVRGRRGWIELARYVIGTAAGGYMIFLLIVVAFYFVLGGEGRDLLLEALREGSVLAFAIVVPGFLLISWVHGLRGRRTRPSRSLTDPEGRAVQSEERRRSP